MLVVGERVHGRHAGVSGEFLHVVLRISPDDRAMNHPAEHARGVLDRLAASDLNLVRAEKHHLSAQLTDADLERHSSACGGFVENQRPALPGQRQFGMMSAFLFEPDGVGQDSFHVRLRQFFQ